MLALLLTGAVLSGCSSPVAGESSASEAASSIEVSPALETADAAISDLLFGLQHAAEMGDVEALTSAGANGITVSRDEANKVWTIRASAEYGGLQCYENIDQKFFAWNVWLLQNNSVGGWPALGFEMIIDWYETVGEVTQDEYGNPDYSNLKRKELPDDRVGLSIRDFLKISGGWPSADYRALNSFGESLRHPRAWDRGTQNIC